MKKANTVILIFVQILCVSWCILTIMFFTPYILTGIAYLNNKYVYPFVINNDIRLTNDECKAYSCIRVGESCRTKSKCLEIYLDNIPQSKNENYYYLDLIYYPSIYLTFVSILDIANGITTPIASFMYISQVWVTKPLDLIRKFIFSNSIIVPILIFSACCVSVFCFVTVICIIFSYLFSNRSNDTSDIIEDQENNKELIETNIEDILIESNVKNKKEFESIDNKLEINNAENIV